jgi:hypothetical protein
VVVVAVESMNTSRVEIQLLEQVVPAAAELEKLDFQMQHQTLVAAAVVEPAAVAEVEVSVAQAPPESSRLSLFIAP